MCNVRVSLFNDQNSFLYASWYDPRPSVMNTLGFVCVTSFASLNNELTSLPPKLYELYSEANSGKRLVFEDGGLKFVPFKNNP